MVQSKVSRLVASTMCEFMALTLACTIAAGTLGFAMSLENSNWSQHPATTGLFITPCRVTWFQFASAFWVAST